VLLQKEDWIRFKPQSALRSLRCYKNHAVLVSQALFSWLNHDDASRLDAPSWEGSWSALWQRYLINGLRCNGSIMVVNGHSPGFEGRLLELLAHGVHLAEANVLQSGLEQDTEH